jgi:hypothetical protein
MSEAKIEIKAGGAEFHATGDQDWVAEQLDKFLANAAKIATLPSVDQDGGGKTPGGTKGDAAIANKPLATFLKERSATTSQVKKFLATAIWLDAKGRHRMTTGDVTNALKDANQTRLGNPADCLNKNVGKGLCEKDGNQFFVTEGGKAP